MAVAARPHLHRGALAVLIVAASLAAGCSPAPTEPPPTRTYTAWLSSPGNPVTWRTQVDGAFVDQGTRQPMSNADAYVELPVQAGQRVTLTAEIERLGFAGCRIVRDDGVEVVPLQQQRIRVSLATRQPPAECTFIG